MGNDVVVLGVRRCPKKAGILKIYPFLHPLFFINIRLIWAVI
jgi:hypothetical protein